MTNRQTQTHPELRTEDDDYAPTLNYAGSDEPMPRPNHKAKKHPRPSRVRNVWPTAMTVLLAASAVLSTSLFVDTAKAGVAKPDYPAALVEEAARRMAYETVCRVDYGSADVSLSSDDMVRAVILAEDMIQEIAGDENELCGVMASLGQ